MTDWLRFSNPMRSKRCLGCGERTTASGYFCRTCQSKLHHARKRIEREGLVVGEAGGVWWVWDAAGEVIVVGKPTRGAAITALAFGDEAETDDTL